MLLSFIYNSRSKQNYFSYNNTQSSVQTQQNTHGTSKHTKASVTTAISRVTCAGHNTALYTVTRTDLTADSRIHPLSSFINRCHSYFYTVFKWAIENIININHIRKYVLKIK